MTRSYSAAATRRRRTSDVLDGIRRHGWLIGLIAGGLLAPWIVR